MSDTKEDQHQCSICGQFVEKTGVESHLRDEHSDAREDIESFYGERTLERVFNGEEDGQPEIILEGGRECGICGEVVQPDEDHDELSIEKAGLHLTTEHPDTDEDVFEVFSELEVPEGSFEDSQTDGEYDSEQTEAEMTSESVASESNQNNAKRTTASTASYESENESASGTTSQSDTDRGVSGSRSDTMSRQEFGTRGKFSVFGVGGAGNNILDAMLMRRDTLRDRNSRLAKAWEGGLQTYVPLNTNDAEIAGTYYDLEDNPDKRPADILENGRIGDGSGAGEDPEIGLLRMQGDVEKGRKAMIGSWPFTSADLEMAQAHMFVHSVVKGTGSGSTPELARYIREEFLNEDRHEKDRTPLMSVTILPNEKAARYNPEATINAGLGVGMAASNVDVLIPFDNERLGKAADDISIEIDGLDDANPAYARANRPLVQFLEAFMLSSNREMRDENSTTGLAGSEGKAASNNGFDVPDSFRPIQNRYPIREEGEIRPGTVACPMIAVSESTRGVDKTGLGILMETALNKGLLVNCKPETAWGGAFMFFGPERPMKDVSRHVQNHFAYEKVREVLGTEELRTNFHQAVVPEVDKLYMWGLLWNPKMPAMEQMWENTKEAKQRNNDQGRLLRQNWDEIRPVYQFLGRENRE
jgi:hypothetical protein